jgi:hypothetical protein
MMVSAKEASPKHRDSSNDDTERRASVANVEKGKWERLWPVIACGAGLFSDGYLNNVRQLQSDTLSYAAPPEQHFSTPAPMQPHPMRLQSQA